MNYIRELYLGNIVPSDQQFSDNSECRMIMKEELDIYDKLSQILSDDNKKLLEKISELHGQIEDIISADSYTMGFRDGARLMIDILLGRNENLNSK